MDVISQTAQQSNNHSWLKNKKVMEKKYVLNIKVGKNEYLQGKINTIYILL